MTGRAAAGGAGHEPGQARHGRAPESKTTAPRCPSRRTGRGTATCAELRRVAADLFLARGYDGVSLDAIVAEAGGSKTNVYAFFGGKEGLFEAALAHACADILAPMDAVRVEGLSLEEGLARLGRALLDLLLTPRSVALFRIAISATGRFPRLGAVWFASGPATSQAIFARFIAARLGEMPSRDGQPADAAVLARLFHDMTVQELLHRALFEPAAGPAARDEAARTAAAAVAALVAIGVGEG
nr:TetR/AcrR family transcriptional regulator [Ancylobacter mangrovi]